MKKGWVILIAVVVVVLLIVGAVINIYNNLVSGRKCKSSLGSGK